jgi:hypothetical protein
MEAFLEINFRFNSIWSYNSNVIYLPSRNIFGTSVVIFHWYISSPALYGTRGRFGIWPRRGVSNTVWFPTNVSCESLVKKHCTICGNRIMVMNIVILDCMEVHSLMAETKLQKHWPLSSRHRRQTRVGPCLRSIPWRFSVTQALYKSEYRRNHQSDQSVPVCTPRNLESRMQCSKVDLDYAWFRMGKNSRIVRHYVMQLVLWSEITLTHSSPPTRKLFISEDFQLLTLRFSSWRFVHAVRNGSIVLRWTVPCDGCCSVPSRGIIKCECLSVSRLPTCWLRLTMNDCRRERRSARAFLSNNSRVTFFQSERIALYAPWPLIVHHRFQARSRESQLVILVLYYEREGTIGHTGKVGKFAPPCLTDWHDESRRLAAYRPNA